MWPTGILSSRTDRSLPVFFRKDQLISVITAFSCVAGGVSPGAYGKAKIQKGYEENILLLAVDVADDGNSDFV